MGIGLNGMGYCGIGLNDNGLDGIGLLGIVAFDGDPIGCASDVGKTIDQQLSIASTNAWA